MKREIKDNKFERKAKEKKRLERKKSKKEERKKNRKTKRNVTPFLFSLQHFIAPALYLMPCLQAQGTMDCNKGIKFKKGAIKSC